MQTMRKPAKKIAKSTGILKVSQKFVAPYSMSVKDIVDSLYDTYHTIKDSFSFSDEDMNLRLFPLSKKAIQAALTEKICMAYVKQDLKDTINCERDERRFEYTGITNANFLYKLKFISKALYDAYYPSY